MAALTQQDLAFAETAPFRAEASVSIDAAPGEVWAVLLDYEAWPEWFVGVTACRHTGSQRFGLGSTREVDIVARGRVSERFIGWEDEALWAFTAVSMRPALFRSLVERVTLRTETSGGTRCTYRMAFEPALVLRPVATMVAKTLSGNLERSLGRLGARVEARSVS